MAAREKHPGFIIFAVYSCGLFCLQQRKQESRVSRTSISPRMCEPTIQILWKYKLFLYKKMMVKSSDKFRHTAVDELPRHTQIYHQIIEKTENRECIFPLEFNYELLNSLWKGDVPWSQIISNMIRLSRVAFASSVRLDKWQFVVTNWSGGVI